MTWSYSLFEQVEDLRWIWSETKVLSKKSKYSKSEAPVTITSTAAAPFGVWASMFCVRLSPTFQILFLKLADHKRYLILYLVFLIRCAGIGFYANSVRVRFIYKLHFPVCWLSEHLDFDCKINDFLQQILYRIAWLFLLFRRLKCLRTIYRQLISIFDETDKKVKKNSNLKVCQFPGFFFVFGFIGRAATTVKRSLSVPVIVSNDISFEEV